LLWGGTAWAAAPNLELRAREAATLAQSPEGTPAAPSLTFRVKCNTGATVNGVLAGLVESPPQPGSIGVERQVVIEIEGLCYENVTLRRDRVTLRGVDPMVDGLSGVLVPGVTIDATLSVRDSGHVRIENLMLTGEVGRGLFLMNSDVQVFNARIVNNPQHGVTAASSAIYLEDTVIQDNGGTLPAAALNVNMASYAECLRCSLVGNTEGVWVDNGSSIKLRTTEVLGNEHVGVYLQNGTGTIQNSTIDGSLALFAEDSYVDVYAVDLSSPDIVVMSLNNSTVDLMAGSTAAGQLRSQDNGNIGIYGLSTASAVRHDISMHSKLQIGHGSTITGDVDVGPFAMMVVHGTVDGNVGCYMAGDTWCANPSDITGSCTGCAHCP
jgi:hypothetical protein